jgi:hypothetical protein
MGKFDTGRGTQHTSIARYLLPSILALLDFCFDYF